MYSASLQQRSRSSSAQRRPGGIANGDGGGRRRGDGACFWHRMRHAARAGTHGRTAELLSPGRGPNRAGQHLLVPVPAGSPLLDLVGDPGAPEQLDMRRAECISVSRHRVGNKERSRQRAVLRRAAIAGTSETKPSLTAGGAPRATGSPRCADGKCTIRSRRSPHPNADSGPAITTADCSRRTVRLCRRLPSHDRSRSGCGRAASGKVALHVSI